MEKLFTHFMQVVLHGSISQAAIFLNITQPAISRSIKTLEERYKVQLFERKARGVELTPAGQIMIERCILIENEMKGMESEINSLFSEKESLRIGSGPAWETPIKEMISNFLFMYPNVHIEIMPNTIENLIPKLISGELDIVLGGENGKSFVENNDVSFIPLMDTRLCIIAHESHKLVQSPEYSLKQLSDYPWVGFQSSNSMLDSINKLLSRERTPPINFILKTGFIEVALALVKKNDALLCATNSLLHKIKNRGFVELPLNEPIWHYHIGVWTKPNAQRRHLINEFIKQIKQQVANNKHHKHF